MEAMVFSERVNGEREVREETCGNEGLELAMVADLWV